VYLLASTLKYFIFESPGVNCIDDDNNDDKDDDESAAVVVDADVAAGDTVMRRANDSCAEFTGHATDQHRAGNGLPQHPAATDRAEVDQGLAAV